MGHAPQLASRLIRSDQHDDGVNCWAMQHFASAVPLTGLVHSYCDYSEQTRGFSTRRELPHPEGVLIFNLGSDVAITGGNGRDLRLRPGQAFLAGIHLRPALSSSPGFQAGVQVELPISTLRRILGESMEAFVDEVAPLEAALTAVGEQLLNAATVEERIGLLDTAFSQSLAVAKPIDPRQRAALRMLRVRPELDIAEIAQQVGWSRKHLADRVRDVTGVGPRSFRRLVRFQALTRALTRSFAKMGQVDWAATAMEHGYCDQSHMIREFREFAGMTPSTFLARLLKNGGRLVED